MSPAHDPTKTPPPKRRAPKGSKGAAGKHVSARIYLDPVTESAWRFLKGKVQRQALVADRIQAKARDLGWTPPATTEEEKQP